MSRPLLLDLFCGAGGAAVGYHRAGFDVIGVDIKPQPRFPFEFFLGDALDLPTSWRTRGFDAIHASPPCQAYSKAQQIQGYYHPDLIGQVRNLLNDSGLPYVIENVPGAPLLDPVVLEGQMFPQLKTQRARWFEVNWPLSVPFLRGPRPGRQAKMGRKPKPNEWMHVVGNFSDVRMAREAMGIDWMTRDELREAIPPAYTQFIGEQLIEHLRRVA